ncbi:hypothetical protein [Tunicatimonas pelagia]|uniref:hypothetical protein n=1 Tax=Tunicatimonas pelagia TaxID=931531 RepID=UPI002666DF86|nr:hypothetical protein [Tunicatimonas pelagia]WKN43331.1 hypothetical protein P0M28_30265 [Tunicatimonas pelagia]
MKQVYTTWLTTLLLFSSVAPLWAQELPIYDNNANRIDITHFQQYLENNQELEEQNSIGSLPTAVFKYQSDTLSTQAINQARLNSDVFEDYTMTIQLPEMPLAQDTLIMMVAVPSSNSEVDDYIINVAVIENQGAKLAYHFDSDNDYSFADEGRPYVFKTKQGIKKVEIRRETDADVRSFYMYDLALMPAFLARYGIKVGKSSVVNNFYYPMLNRHGRLSLQLRANFGQGDHTITYQTPSLSREIAASLDAISQFGVSLTYALYNLNVGGFIQTEGNQIGQTERYTFEGGVRSIDYGFGNWPRRRIIYGAELSYDFRVYNNIYLAPVIRYGTYRFRSDEVFVTNIGVNLNEELTYNEIFQNRSLYSLGGQVKFPLGEKALLLIEGSWMKNSYQLNPDFIQETVEEGSLSFDYKAITFGIGVQWILLGQ